MTLQEAKELQSMLQQGNPFVRISTELARKAERANRILLKETQKEVLSKEPEALF